MTNAEALLDEIIASDQVMCAVGEFEDERFEQHDGPLAETARQVKAHVIEQERLKKELVEFMYRVIEDRQGGQNVAPYTPYDLPLAKEARVFIEKMEK